MIIGLEHVSLHGADGRKWLVDVICPPPGGIQLEWTGLLLAALPVGWSLCGFLLGASLMDVRHRESVHSAGSPWDCDRQTSNRNVFSYHWSSLLLPMQPGSPKSIQTGCSYPRPLAEDSWTEARAPFSESLHQSVWKTSAEHHQLAPGFWRRTCRLLSAVSPVVAELPAADFNCSWRSWNASRPLRWTLVCLKTVKMSLCLSLWESNPAKNDDLPVRYISF